MTAVHYAIARRLHEDACDRYGGRPLDGLASPFGRPATMPEHHWIVSLDVDQALTTMSVPSTIPNPKSTDGYLRLLFGWPVVVDRGAAPGTLRLVLG